MPPERSSTNKGTLPAYRLRQINIPALDSTQADQFALILLSGCPTRQAVVYFLPAASTDQLDLAADEWPRQSEVLEAIKRYTNDTAWHQLSDEERIQYALRRHYNQMAHFLWTHDYGDLAPLERNRADTCRAALEAHARASQEGSSIAAFYEDILKRAAAEQQTALARDSHPPALFEADARH